MQTNRFDILYIFRRKSFFTLLLIVMSMGIWIAGSLDKWEMSVKPVLLMIGMVYMFFSAFYFSRAMLLGVLYWAVVALCVSFHPLTFRWSTLIYKALFIGGFIAYYNAVYTGCFTRQYFIKILRFLMFAYFGTLVAQQIFIRITGGYIPLEWINYFGIPDKPNMLALEVSHVARLLTIFMLALLRLYQIEQGNKKLTISELWRRDKWVVMVYLYCMLMMGSGTAFLALPLLFFYFLHRRGLLIVVPTVIALYFALPYIDYAPVQRARVTVEAILTGDSDDVVEADGSAAARVVPLLNTINNLDITSANTWFGEGIDTQINDRDRFSDKQTTGNITDYGLLSYIVSLVFVFSCCIRRFLSLETVIFILLFGASISNVAYGWAALMVFATIGYFQMKSQKSDVDA